MIIFKTKEGYYISNAVNGAFDVLAQNYIPDEEDCILNFD